MSGLLRRGRWALTLGAVTALAWCSASAEPLLHTVRPGDSLWVVARRYGVSAEELARANSLRDPRRIHSGLKLVIPRTHDATRLSSDEDGGVVLAAAVDNASLPQPVESAYRAPLLAAEVAPAREMPAVAREAAGSPRRADSAATARHEPPPQPAAARDLTPAAAAVKPRARTLATATAPAPAPEVAAPQALESAAAAISGAMGKRPTQPSHAKPELPAAASASALFSSSAKQRGGYGLMAALDFVLKLVLVLILAYVCMLALKKFAQRRIGGAGKHGAGLQVVDTIGLAPNRQLHVVALGDRAYLLGSTPESVSLIADVSQMESITELLGGGRKEQADPAFARRVKELMKVAPAGRGAQPGMGGRLVQAAQFIKARSNQMRPLGEIIDETLAG